MGARPGATLCGIQKSMTIAELAELLEPSLGMPVIDDTALTEPYDFNLEADTASTRAFLTALTVHSGLTFVDDRREIAVLQVQPV
jgi:uncharacterized protein (TIGR03435 family)